MNAEAELLSIELFSSDEESAQKRRDRDHQSVSDFQKQKESWKPKLENGEVWRLALLYLSIATERLTVTWCLDMEDAQISHGEPV